MDDNSFDKFRLYGSVKTRGRLKLASGVLGTAALVLLYFASFGLSLLCATTAGTLVLVAQLLRSGESECSFCMKSRGDLKLLVAGPVATICDECTKLALEIMADDNDKNGQADWLDRILASLPRRCPRAISSPLFQALQVKDATHRAKLLRRAFDLGNPAAMIELIARIPEVERTGSDWINLGVALEELGRFAEAIAATERVAGDPEQEPWLLNNRGTARIEAEPCSEPVLRSLLADNLRARELLGEKKPPGFEEPLSAMWGAAAELHRRLGEREDALRCLGLAEKLSGHRSGHFLTRAKLSHAEGRHEEAAKHLARVLELAHPESRDAQRAHSLFAEWARPSAESVLSQTPRSASDEVPR